MDNYHCKGDISYSDILNEDIERKLNKIKIYKKFSSYINKYENSLDSLTLITPTEDNKRRKKVVNNNVISSIKLDDDDIIEDLNNISRDGSNNIRILDTSLCIKNNKFSKGDKIVVRGRRDDYVGSITNVEENEISVKSKDGKRNKIKLADIKKHVVSISRYVKK